MKYLKQLIAAILLLYGLTARGADDGFENPQRARFEAARQMISPQDSTYHLIASE